MSPEPRQQRVLAVSSVYNEEKAIARVITQLRQAGITDIAIFNDGSTDQTAQLMQEQPGVVVLRSGLRQGLGTAARTLIDYARTRGYDIMVTLAGNGKDDPAQIPRLLKPLLEEGYDLVQGSRYLPGGGYTNMPFYRWLGTRLIYPLLFFLVSGRWLTDATNGFRAFRMSLFHDPRINIRQDWLSHYEMEPYILYKAVTLGYKVKEVPVSKNYPKRGEEYTKMKPITDWWSILRPLVLLGLRIKR